jgi:FlaA1/EpsC-like NDP-sugar epimerase
MAERLIRAMGRTPNRDIEIVETGLRPGEKLYEELLTADEGLTATPIERVNVAVQQQLDYGAFGARLDRLIVAARCDDRESVVALLADLAPSFRPGEHWQPSPPKRADEALAIA